MRQKASTGAPPYDPDLEELIRQAESIELLEEDGEPLESEWHALQIPLLIELVRQHLGDPHHYYCAGNMFIYYSKEQADAVRENRAAFKGPDFFVVRDVDGTQLRKYWVTWQEGGRYPDLVIELVSPKTVRKDKEENLRFYATVLRVPEYFWYDPDRNELRGFRLDVQRLEYVPIEPNEQGWLWSNVLEAYLGVQECDYLQRRARWLRLYRADGRLVPTHAERAEQAEAELQRLREQLRQRGVEL